ncbi:MAG: sigma-70 family RNA polymerase sigma factor [Firmicutes bacterium]|nr:sigma-70 family RNA polymerase sigma factor [Bacillota bacterium]
MDDREDLIQETFAKYFASYSKKSPDWSEVQIRSALITIFKNCYVDYVRKLSSRPVTYVDPVQIESGEVSASHLVGNDPQNMILEEQEHQDVMDALDKMKPEWSEIIKKLVIEDRPVEEVSEELGISKEACRTRLCRARDKLRKMVNRGAPEKTSDPKKPKRKKSERKAAKCEDNTIARAPDSSGIPGSI